jgi:hypothetical protein
MAGTTGLEPATSDVTGRRSNQLNYVPAAYFRIITYGFSSRSIKAQILAWRHCKFQDPNPCPQIIWAL